MPPEHETEASPAPDTDVTASSSTATDQATDTATDVKEAPKPSLLDVIKDVVEPEAEAPEDSSTPDPEKSEPEKTDEAAPAETSENFDGLPFGRHPRFKALVEDRNSFKAKAADLETRVEELKRPADQYARIEQFMQANEISTEEMVNLFKLAALTKSDPKEALSAIQPLVTELYERTGRILPEDIRKDVEEGRITEDRGRELAEARADKAESERRAARAEGRATSIEQSSEDERRSGALAATLVDWEAAIKEKDPDFAVKEELIADRCRTIIATKGQPKTPAEMKAVLDQAHEDVTAHLRKVMPKRPEIRRSPESPSSLNATAVPKSLLEAVSLAATQAK